MSEMIAGVLERFTQSLLTMRRPFQVPPSSIT